MALAKLLSDRRRTLRYSVHRVRKLGGISSVSSVFRWEHGVTPYRHALPKIARGYKLALPTVVRAWETQRAADRKARAA